jgi:hypothetical protein
MQRFFTRIILFMVILLLPLGLTRIVGASEFVRERHVWSIDTTCAAACWLDIQAGKTSLEQAQSILNNDPHYKFKSRNDKQTCWDGVGDDGWDLCVSYPPTQLSPTIIDQITIRPTGNRLELGELINRLGQPYTMEVCKLGNYVTLRLYFEGNIASQTHFRLQPWEMKTPRLVPRLYMGHVTFNASPASLGRHHVQAWRGFASLQINDVCLA